MKPCKLSSHPQRYTLICTHTNDIKIFIKIKIKKNLKRDKNLSLYNNILLFLIIEIYVNLFLVLGENMSFSLHFYFIYMLKNIIRKGGSFQCGNSIKTCYQLNN